nr:caffeic acid 3-O-methyltransferase-like [Tanacetum cinerariifolium]
MLFTMSTSVGINHVGGDMFQDGPQGEDIFMMNCYNKALPWDGKIIIVDVILSFLPHTSSSVKFDIELDAVMMTRSPEGKDRSKEEFLALAIDAGFKRIEKKSGAFNF